MRWSYARGYLHDELLSRASDDSGCDQKIEEPEIVKCRTAILTTFLVNMFTICMFLLMYRIILCFIRVIIRIYALDANIYVRFSTLALA